MSLCLRRSRWWIASLSLAVGCGDAPAEPEAPQFQQGELTIELEPVATRAWLEFFDAGDNGLTSDAFIPLVWGEGYPTTLELTFDRIQATCGSAEGSFTFDTLTVAPGGAAELRRIGTDRLEIVALGEGSFTATARGRFEPSTQTPCAPGLAAIDVEFQIDGRVSPIASVQLGLPAVCGGANRLRMQSETHFFHHDGPRITLLDPAGEAFSPVNATPARPVTLTVTGEPEVLLGLHGDRSSGLEQLEAQGEPQVLTVSALGQPIAEIDLLAAADIEEVDFGFELLGYAAGNVPLTSGETYGQEGWSRTTSSLAVLAREQRVDGEPLCTQPHPDGFVLASSTPQTCAAYAEPVHLEKTGLHGELEVSAEVEASGRCALWVEAPDMAAGQGIRAELSVEILSADELQRLGESVGR